MADALCGPSNSLQSFRKHTQLDRTLQQDRLVAQNQPHGQGFRTLDPRAGSLDAELYAFEHGAGAAASPLFGLQHQHQPPPQFSQPHTPNVAHAPPLGTQGGWAADFQRLQINQTPSPGPIPVQHFRSEAPLVRSTGWGGEFMRAQQHVAKGKEVHRGPESSLLQQSQPQPQQGYGFMNGSSAIGMGMGYGVEMQQPQSQMAGMEQQQQQQQQQQDPQLSQADFDAAFDEAMAEMQKMQDEQSQQQPEIDEAPSLAKSDIRIGSDTIDYTEQAERTADQDHRDADELARTAGHLLNLVQHDTSDKFQNSQFLELMRKLRDREVEVQDNDLHARSGTAASQSQMTAEPPADLRPHDPNQFSFPDLNDVYVPTAADLQDAGAQDPPAGSWQQQPTAPMQAPPSVANASDADAMYSSASDEYPQSELHPGGRYYPEMSPRMTGARRYSVGRAMGEGQGGAAA